MKRFLLVLLVVFIFTCPLVYAGNLVKKVYFSEYPILIDGEEYSSETPILNYQHRTYVSLREFSEMIGVEIDFENDTIYIKTEEEVKEIERIFDNENTLAGETGSNNEFVYISKGGSKYHYLDNCSRGSYSKINLAEAITKGYTPCLRCVKNN